MLGIRPEDLHPAGAETPPHAAITGTVLLTEQLGMEAVVHLEIDARLAVVPGREPSPNGQRTASPTSTRRPGATRILARLQPGAPPAIGRPLSLVPDPRRMYLFRPHTGDAVRGPVGTPPAPIDRRRTAARGSN